MAFRSALSGSGWLGPGARARGDIASGHLLCQLEECPHLHLPVEVLLCVSTHLARQVGLSGSCLGKRDDRRQLERRVGVPDVETEGQGTWEIDVSVAIDERHPAGDVLARL